MKRRGESLLKDVGSMEVEEGEDWNIRCMIKC